MITIASLAPKKVSICFNLVMGTLLLVFIQGASLPNPSPRDSPPFHDSVPKVAQKPRFLDFWRRKGFFCSLNHFKAGLRAALLFRN